MTDEKNAKKTLLFTQEGAVAIVSINKPPMNMMSLEFFDKLEKLVPKLSTDRSVSDIVISAEGEENSAHPSPQQVRDLKTRRSWARNRRHEWLRESDFPHAERREAE